MGGLIGGEANVWRRMRRAPMRSDTLLGKDPLQYGSVEVNASMGTIAAALTTRLFKCSGVLFALQEERGPFEAELKADCSRRCGWMSTDAEQLRVRSGSRLSGGTFASAMAAAAAVGIDGRKSEDGLEAASLALSNLLGLVCDPDRGLGGISVRAGMHAGAANALTCAELVSGICHPIPFDEMASMMHRVGRSLPMELRETALGGCAATLTGQRPVKH